MSRWREPIAGEIMLTLDRWQIESIDWSAYVSLGQYPNRYDHDRETVTWVLKESDYTWLCLRWPELAEPTLIPRGGPPTIGWPSPGRL